MNRWHAVEGSPIPHGVSYVADEDAYNFALYSKHATGVTLLLYAPDDVVEPVSTHELCFPENKTGRVWHCRLPASVVDRAWYYAYRVDGPWEPDAGHRFDRHKVLVDPAARGIHLPETFSREAARGAGPNDGKAPLGILGCVRQPYDWTDDVHPLTHQHDLVIYELHVRGFTKTDPTVPPEHRGTFAGVVDKIPYLRDLGVTAVELMPVFQADPQEGSYWGYMTLGFFALHHAYSSVPDHGEQIGEFRDMVAALHEAGIEVILDVVYNHTTEGHEAGPTYSYRGIDNSTYYLLQEDRRFYRDDAGTGNVLNTANSHVRSFVLDSLRYWVDEMHVDGFRFDLASIFTRRDDGTVDLHDPPIISAIRSDPVLANVRLIAEAWDINSYQLGRAFPGLLWEQWNGRFRDDVRSFVRGDDGYVPALMQRIYGSDDLFPDTVEHAYRPFQSINFITAHDGFTLYDLVAYTEKDNWANGWENRDGSDDNRSWNSGHEGDDDVPAEVVDLRKRQARNFIAILMLSNGAPMFRMGDEFLQTQRGNNNPYNQDNELSWLDWSRLETHGDVHRFMRQMIAFRKAHPSIARSTYWRDDVSWHGVGLHPDLTPASHSLAFCLRGQDPGGGPPDDDLYVMINAWDQALRFEIQEPGDWHRVLDTGLPSPDDFAEDLVGPAMTGNGYEVGPRSVVVLLRHAAT